MMIIVGDLNWLLSLTKINIVFTGFGELNASHVVKLLLSLLDHHIFA